MEMGEPVRKCDPHQFKSRMGSYSLLKEERERVRRERKEVEKALALRMATNSEFSAIQSRSLMTARRILLQQMEEARGRRTEFKREVNRTADNMKHVKHSSTCAANLKVEQNKYRQLVSELYPKWHNDVLANQHAKLELMDKMREDSEARRAEAELAFQKEKALIEAVTQRRQELLAAVTEERKDAIRRESMRRKLSEGVSDAEIDKFATSFGTDDHTGDLSTTLEESEMEGGDFKIPPPILIPRPGRVSFQESAVSTPGAAFIPTYSWQTINEGQVHPEGLQIEPKLDGTGQYQAKIPNPWIASIDTGAPHGVHCFSIYQDSKFSDLCGRIAKITGTVTSNIGIICEGLPDTFMETSKISTSILFGRTIKSFFIDNRLITAPNSEESSSAQRLKEIEAQLADVSRREALIRNQRTQLQEREESQRMMDTSNLKTIIKDDDVNSIMKSYNDQIALEHDRKRSSEEGAKKPAVDLSPVERPKAGEQSPAHSVSGGDDGQDTVNISKLSWKEVNLIIGNLTMRLLKAAIDHDGEASESVASWYIEAAAIKKRREAVSYDRILKLALTNRLTQLEIYECPLICYSLLALLSRRCTNLLPEDHITNSKKSLDFNSVLQYVKRDSPEKEACYARLVTHWKSIHSRDSSHFKEVAGIFAMSLMPPSLTNQPKMIEKVELFIVGVVTAKRESDYGQNQANIPVKSDTADAPPSSPPQTRAMEHIDKPAKSPVGVERSVKSSVNVSKPVRLAEEAVKDSKAESKVASPAPTVRTSNASESEQNTDRGGRTKGNVSSSESKGSDKGPAPSSKKSLGMKVLKGGDLDLLEHEDDDESPAPGLKYNTARKLSKPAIADSDFDF